MIHHGDLFDVLPTLDFIGIEREAEYIQIAEARITAVAPLFGEATA